MDDMKPLGEIKLTNQKFFRINGGSTQLKGVESDIVLPDTYSDIEYGENEYDFALPWTQIEKLDYEQSVFEIGNKDKLVKLSQERVSSNSKFDLVQEQSKLVKQFREESEFSLNLETYRQYLNDKEEKSKKFESIMDEDIQSLKIKNLAIDAEAIAKDEAKAERNTDWIKGIQKDFYLEETLFIMSDLLNLKS